MTFEQAFDLIEGRDFEEGSKRQTAPRFSLIQINREGEIVCVERSPKPATEAEQFALMNRHPGTIQISAQRGTFGSVDELRSRVQGSLWAFSRMKRPRG